MEQRLTFTEFLDRALLLSKTSEVERLAKLAKLEQLQTMLDSQAANLAQREKAVERRETEAAAVLGAGQLKLEEAERREKEVIREFEMLNNRVRQADQRDAEIETKRQAFKHAVEAVR